MAGTVHFPYQYRLRRTALKALAAGMMSACLLSAQFLPGAHVILAKDLPTVSEEIFAMDTYMSISASGEAAREAVDASLEEIRRLDDLWSVGNEDSEVARLNRHESVELSEDTRSILERAIQIGTDTEGAFDITIFPLMQEWGFTTGDYKVPSDKRRSELLRYVDVSALDPDMDDACSLPENVQIDLGGIAKGYTSDRVMEIFEEYGVAGGIVSLGGNVETYRTKADGSAWRVGIRNPDPSVPALSGSELTGIVQASDLAVITSGGYERYFEKDGITYHHILDPGTGMPADSGLISVTIVSRDGCLADALSTSLFVMGKEKALAYWETHSDSFDVILVEEDGGITVTRGLDGIFSSELKYEIYPEG